MAEPPIGTMYDVLPVAWDRFCESFDYGPWTRPQPLININTRTGRFMLAFPYYWWDPADLEEMRHG